MIVLHCLGCHCHCINSMDQGNVTLSVDVHIAGYVDVEVKMKPDD